MRITEQQRTQIVAKIKEVMGGEVNIMLFGSRVNDLAKGGDIDLYIKTPNPVENLSKNIMAIEAKLISALGDQKFDILLDAPNLPKSKILQVAQQTGILL
jgi:predicted nucleotidyltransferase